MKVPSTLGADVGGETDSVGGGVLDVAIKEGKGDKLGLLEINEGTFERKGMLDGILDGSILEG